MWGARIYSIFLRLQCIVALQLSNTMPIQQPPMATEQMKYGKEEWGTEFPVLFNIHSLEFQFTKLIIDSAVESGFF